MNWAKGELQGAGIEQPLLEAELLMAAVLGIKRLELIIRYKEEISADSLSCFKQYIKLRKKRWPVSYILKNAYFYGLKLSIEKGVLIPRPETELLVEELIKTVNSSLPIVNRKKIKILEIGVGSGAIAVALTKNIVQAIVYGTEISGTALRIARKNLKLYGVMSKIVLKKGNLFGPFKEKFAVIVSNPPYLSDKDFQSLQPEVGFEPKSALYGGKDGLRFYRRIIGGLKNYLDTPGMLALEIGYGQAPRIKKMLERENLFKRIEIKKDYSGIKRIIIAQNW